MCEFIVVFLFVAQAFGDEEARSSSNKQKPTSSTSREQKQPLPKDPWSQQQKLLDHPEMKKLFKRQGQRRETLNTAKEKGLIGESETGYLKVRTTKGLKEGVAKKILSLVQSENNDRKKIYEALERPHRKNSDNKKIFRQSLFETHKKWDPPGAFYFQDKKWHKNKGNK